VLIQEKGGKMLEKWAGQVGGVLPLATNCTGAGNFLAGPHRIASHRPAISILFRSWAASFHRAISAQVLAI